MMGLDKESLVKLYTKKRKSAREISRIFECSESKVHYWLERHHIPKRSISDALYTRWNPKGDPFIVRPIISLEDSFLQGLGLGLYWGEGTKRNAYSIRLGNTDPAIITAFVHFLRNRFGVKKAKLHFGLQIFSDMDATQALMFWSRRLGVTRRQFQKVIVTPARSLGTYRHKSQHGVLTVYFNNKRLRQILGEEIERLQRMY